MNTHKLIKPAKARKPKSKTRLLGPPEKVPPGPKPARKSGDGRAAR